MAVSRVQCTQCEQAFDTLATCFTDADQDTSGEGHVSLAAQTHGFQARRRMLVRGAMVGHAFATQTFRCAFEHDAHGRRHWTQQSDFVGCHGSGIEVRQYPGFVEYARRDVP